VSGERRGPRKTPFVVGNRKLATSDRQSAFARSGLPDPGSAVLSVRKFPFLEVCPACAVEAVPKTTAQAIAAIMPRSNVDL
jgi:hypothetical protein